MITLVISAVAAGLMVSIAALFWLDQDNIAHKHANTSYNDWA